MERVVEHFTNDKNSLTEKKFKTIEVRPTVYSPAQLAIIFKREDWLQVVYQQMVEEEFAREVLNLPTNPQQPP